MTPVRPLVLPRELRPELRRPWGPVYPSPSESTYRKLKSRAELLITVGDVTTRSFLRAGARPNVAVVDGRVMRTVPARSADRFPITLEARNPPGTITPQAWDALERALDHALHGDPTLLRIVGEEDLLALPALALAPENSIVCYGLPGEGMVAVPVTPRARSRALRLLRRFRGSEAWRSRL